MVYGVTLWEKVMKVVTWFNRSEQKAQSALEQCSSKKEDGREEIQKSICKLACSSSQTSEELGSDERF